MMRAALGMLLVLAGGAVMLYGIGSALVELVGLYQGAMTDPLGDSREGGEVSVEMARSVLIGSAGVLPFIIGTVLLKISFVHWIRRKARGGQASRQELDREYREARKRAAELRRRGELPDR